MTSRRFAQLSNEDLRHIDQVCEDFESALRLGQRVSIEQELNAIQERLKGALLSELLAIELEDLLASKVLPSMSEYLARFPDCCEQVQDVFERTSKGRPLNSTDENLDAIPRRIGRYRTEKLLGKGGFGLVFRARDDQLERDVAIKVPIEEMATQPFYAQAYRREAKRVAGLDHPNIVPIYDVGSNEEFPCYAVSKFIDGSSLEAKLRHHSFEHGETARLIATIADALHHAHKKGLVHRDVKPANILIDGHGQPFLTDFGLALHDEEIGDGPKMYAGTPAYMSPEQARGEGDRVDGRSDVFSLGAVMYEMLTGQRAFRGSTKAAIMESVINWEPRPPRQYDDGLVPELERICLKCLAKQKSDRYSSAHDLAEELKQFLSTQSSPSASETGRKNQVKTRRSGAKKRNTSETAPETQPIASASVATAVEEPIAPSEHPVVSPSISSYWKLILGVFVVAALGTSGYFAQDIFNFKTPAGTLIVEMDHVDAIIEMDGKELKIKRPKDKKPLTISVDEGKHQLVIRKRGFKIFTKEITIDAGEKDHIHVRLEPLEQPSVVLLGNVTLKMPLPANYEIHAGKVTNQGINFKVAAVRDYVRSAESDFMLRKNFVAELTMKRTAGGDTHAGAFFGVGLGTPNPGYYYLPNQGVWVEMLPAEGKALTRFNVTRTRNWTEVPTIKEFTWSMPDATTNRLRLTKRDQTLLVEIDVGTETFQNADLSSGIIDLTLAKYSFFNKSNGHLFFGGDEHVTFYDLQVSDIAPTKK